VIRKLFTHTAIYGLAPQLTRVVAFFTLPIITKDLTSLDYGVMGVITSYTTAIGILATLGLRLILINSFYKHPKRFLWVWRSVYGFLTWWNFVYALLMGIVIYLVVPKEVIDQRFIILFASITPLVAFGPIAEIGSTYYQVHQRPWEVAVRSAISGVLTIFFNVYFISYMKLGFMGWFWSQFVVGILFNLSYFIPMYFKYRLIPILNFRWQTMRRHLNVSLPILPHSYSTYLLDSSDRVVMNLLNVTTENVGRYNIAYMFGSVVQSVGMASGLALGPLMNEHYIKKDDVGARNLVFILQIAFFFGTFLLCLWLREFFSIMIKNADLAQMYPLGIIIIMGYNYRPMYFGANNALFFAEKTNLLWRVTLVAGLINVGLNFIAIPIFGFEAAGVTTYIALLYMGYAGYYFKIFKKINSANYYPVRWLLATVALTVLAYVLRDVAWMIKSIVTAIAVAVVALLYWFNRSRISL